MRQIRTITAGTAVLREDIGWKPMPRNARAIAVSTLMLICLAAQVFAAPKTSPATQPGTRPATAPATRSVTWHATMKDVYAAAMRQNKPIFLIVGAQWCGPCKVLEKEMAKPRATAELARWACVHLDADHSDEAAGFLQTGAIPLLRVLSPTGRRIDMKEGAMDEAALVAWLGKQYERAIAAAGEELLESGEPDAAAVRKLIARLDDADPTLREAAVKRLLPHPRAAAGSVVEAFAKGNLAVRLAGLELLSEWKAPVAGLDPWQPESINNQSLKVLLDWVAKAPPAISITATRPVDLTPEQLRLARIELARMVNVPGEDDARAARDRLARFGRALLPDVLAMLKEASTDQARQRLLAMRYRLAASDVLALAWRGGIDRLAATDAPTRQAAAEELVSRATAADSPLLLELFSDPDPLVREISLRGLRTVGKGDAARALLNLLADPDANVRAAVLKQLAEKPVAGTVEAIVAFTATEKDPDLIVHAIHVLKEAKTNGATRALLNQLANENWRIRAGAAEALAEVAGHSSGDASMQADINVAMVKLLDDRDGFVVSRAVTALQSADLPMAIEPMIKAAERHPELVPDVIRAITQGSRCSALAVPHLRKFCAHRDAQIRSQAIFALIGQTGEVESEMKTLLKDPDAGVRMWAAVSLSSLINSWRPGGDGRRYASRRNEAGDAWQWMVDFRGGKNRPAWMLELIPDLQQLMANPSPQARIDAAIPLLQLGPQEKPLEVIRGAVRAEPGQTSRAAAALPWIAIDLRLELFRLLVELDQKADNLDEVIQRFTLVSNPRVAPAIWALLENPRADARLARVVLRGLERVKEGLNSGGSDEMVLLGIGGRGARSPQPEIEALRKRVGSGNEMTRLAALVRLASLSIDAAAEEAQKLLVDAGAPAALKADALQVRLLCLRHKEAAPLAISLLSSKQAAERAMGLTYLESGTDSLQRIRNEIYLSISNPDLSEPYLSQQSPWVAVVPEGLKPEMLRPFLTLAGDDDKEDLSLRAAYLLALLGERDGMDLLISEWRGAERRYSRDERRLYRAIAALGDDEYVPILDEIYKSYNKDRYQTRQLYWTIRIMKGEKALLLRKKIRDEVGMEALR